MMSRKGAQHVVELGNGIRVVFDVDHGHPTASVGILVASGSRFEDEHSRGLSHFMEHMLFQGTERRSSLELSSAIEDVGGDVNASTGLEYTMFHAIVPSAHTALALDVLSDMIMHSVFGEEDIDRERGVIEQEILGHLDSPWCLLIDGLESTAYHDDPVGQDALGTVESVRSFHREDFLRYYARHFTAPRLVVSLAGDVDMENAVGSLEKTIGTIPVGHDWADWAVPAWNSGTIVTAKPIDQVHLAMALPGYADYTQESLALALVSRIFGGSASSRLFRRLRQQESLVYSVSSASTACSNAGMFCIMASSSANNASRVKTAILEEIDKMHREKITAKELRRVKDAVLGGTLIALESFHSRMMRNAVELYTHNRIESIPHIAREVNAVTLRDVGSVIDEVFDTSKLVVSTVCRD